FAGGAAFNATKDKVYSIAVNGTCGAGKTGYLELNLNPPAYADRANAIPLSGQSGATNANNRGAAPFEPVSGSSIGDGMESSVIWFTWTPVVDGEARFSTRGSSFQNGIGVFYADFDGVLTSLPSTPERHGSEDMTIDVDVIGSHKYWIAVGGAGGWGF